MDIYDHRSSIKQNGPFVSVGVHVSFSYKQAKMYNSRMAVLYQNICTALTECQIEELTMDQFLIACRQQLDPVFFNCVC